MADITIQIDKQEVYEEVSKGTAYIGGKNVDANGKTLYDQVFVTDADKEVAHMHKRAHKPHVALGKVFILHSACAQTVL